jgi:cold shock CspA family protein
MQVSGRSSRERVEKYLLNKGQHVSFEVVQGEKGPQAEKVQILG